MAAGLLQEDGLHRLLQCRRARALDIRRSLSFRKEVGYFIPSITACDRQAFAWTIDGKDRCRTRDPDPTMSRPTKRGYIYIVDRANTGMHILELTGPAPR